MVATNHSEFCEPRTLAAIAERRRRRLPGRRPVELLGRGAGVRLRLRAGRARARADEQGAGHRRRRHDRRRGRAAAARRSRVRGARLRPAPGAAVDARGLRGPHRRPARAARAGPRGDEGLHARDPPRGDRRRDRELPPPAAHAHGGQQRALQRRLPGGARRSTSSASCTCPPRWCSSAPSSSRRPRTYLPDCPVPISAYGFSKLTGEVYCRAAHDEHGLPVHDLPALQRLRPRRDARRGAGHRARRARPDQEGAVRPAAAADLRLAASRRGRSRTSTTSPTGSSRRWARPQG